MGNTHGRTLLHKTASRSRSRHPQYNTDNKSSSELGQASTESSSSAAASPDITVDGATRNNGGELQGWSLVHVRPEPGGAAASDPESAHMLTAGNLARHNSVDIDEEGRGLAVPGERARRPRVSTEAVRGTPLVDVRRSIDGPWGPANTCFYDRDVFAVGTWADA